MGEGEIRGSAIARLNGKEILLNKDYLGQTQYNLDDIISHEFGHEAYMALNQGEVPDITDLLSPGRQYALGLVPSESTLMALDKISHNEGELLSPQAAMGGDEYFSEAFAAYTRGDRSNINPRVLSILDRLAKRKKGK